MYVAVRYETKRVLVDTDKAEDEFNQLANDGWELVSVIEVDLDPLFIDANRVGATIAECNGLHVYRNTGREGWFKRVKES